MLVLLDIDGTLLTSEGIGARGIVQAGVEDLSDVEAVLHWILGACSS